MIILGREAPVTDEHVAQRSKDTVSENENSKNGGVIDNKHVLIAERRLIHVKALKSRP